MKTRVIHCWMFQLTMIVLLSLTCNRVEAQQGYSKDSLQIKVYTVIEYQRYRATNIKVTKVFCDYCSENQIKLLKEIAREKAYNDRHLKENIMKEGKKRLAIYLRLPKDKFRKIRNE